MSGVFGTFRCTRLFPADFQETRTFFCSECYQPLRPGPYWNCVTCPPPGFPCCNECHASRTTITPTTKHVHSFVQEYLFKNAVANGSCCTELILTAFDKFGTRPFLGVKQPLSMAVSWMTYSEVSRFVFSFYRSLENIGISQTDTFILVADLSQPYVIAMLAGVISGAVIVPAHGEQSVEHLAHVFSETFPKVAFVDLKYYDKVLSAATLASVHVSAIVVNGIKTDNSPTTDIPSYAMSYSEFIQKGELLQKEGSAIFGYKKGTDELAAVLYTSGTTGPPKGVMYTEGLILPTPSTSTNVYFVRFDFQPFHPSFLVSLLSIVQCGGCRVISTNLGTIFEDLAIVRPTHISAPPIFFNSVYRHHCVTLWKALEAAKRSSHDVLNIPEIEKEIAQKTRMIFGNRLVSINSGGAPISENISRFFEEKLKLPLPSLYGCREAGPIAMNGVIYPGIEVIVLPVPELGLRGYESDPPMGEIAVHTPRIVSGYYKNSEKTEEAFVYVDNKRYYKTGDIGRLTKIQGGRTHVTLLDRCKAVTKLATSEWISPTNLESILEENPWVAQAFVVASPEYNFPVALVVPSHIVISEGFAREAISEKIWSEIHRWCVHHHLPPSQTPHSVFVELDDTWNTQNGCLTSTDKKRRHVLMQRYDNQIQELFKKQINFEIPSTRPDTEPTKEISPELLEIFRELFSGEIPERINDSTSLVGLGADSLLVARFCALLAKKGVDVDAKSIFSYPLSHIDILLNAPNKVESLGEFGNRNNCFDTGLLLRTVKAYCTYDWDLETALDVEPCRDDVEEKVREAESTCPQSKRDGILVTGCTGFFGPFLISETFAGTLYFIVRGRDVRDASERLKADLEACNRYNVLHNRGDDHDKREDYDNHENDNHNNRDNHKNYDENDNKTYYGGVGDVVILKGDVSLPHLGITESEWCKLLTTVSHIFHSASVVNMSLPYMAMKGSNVNSTKQIIRLAVEIQQKFGVSVPINYISSISAMSPENFEFESTELESIAPLDMKVMDAKGGYGQTKIVSEILLKKAASAFGLGVRIFRVGAISGDTQTGFLNCRDITTCLLASYASIGAFVRNSKKKFQWIPVDFVSRAVVAISADPQTLQKVFHLCGSGTELTEIVDVFMKLDSALHGVTSTEWAKLAEEKIRFLAQTGSRVPSWLSIIKLFLPSLEEYFSTLPREVPMEKTQEVLTIKGLKVPKIDEDIITCYIQHLLKCYK